MNVFVLCTGRCGSTTFARACSHITNFTAAHESRLRMVGDSRLAYPPDHIEVDNRLAWFLGRLDEAYGTEARYVHLTRDEEAVARSLNVFQQEQIARPRRWRRWGPLLLVRAYGQGIINAGETDPLAIARDLVHTVNSNIRSFLKDKPHRMDFRMEDAEADFPAFWKWIGAEGDMEAAMAEWTVRHNTSGNRKPKGRLLPSWLRGRKTAAGGGD